MKTISKTTKKEIHVHDNALPDFQPVRSCTANDLIFAGNGVQCANCGADCSIATSVSQK